MKKILFILMIFALFLTSCSIENKDDYKNSISVKQFLFDHAYTLRIDGVEKTKYSKEFKCNKDSIIELMRQDDFVISGIIIVDKNVWYKFPDTDVYINLLAGG